MTAQVGSSEPRRHSSSKVAQGLISKPLEYRDNNITSFIASLASQDEFETDSYISEVYTFLLHFTKFPKTSQFPSLQQSATIVSSI